MGLVFSYREIGDSEMKIYCKLVPALELSQNRREFHCSSDFPYSFPNNPPRRTGGSKSGTLTLGTIGNSWEQLGKFSELNCKPLRISYILCVSPKGWVSGGTLKLNYLVLG